MKKDGNELINIFRERNALLEGHFILSSGLHSDKYLQCALLLQDPQMAEMLGKQLAAKITSVVETVVSPALGGLIIGHEVARALGVRHIFTEKDAAGKPVLRRGFSIKPEEKILIVEDVLTTGKSTREVMTVVRGLGGDVMAVGAIVNRSNKESTVLFPEIPEVQTLLTVSVQTWPADDVPPEIDKIPAVKPGSRKI